MANLILADDSSTGGSVFHLARSISWFAMLLRFRANGAKDASPGQRPDRARAPSTALKGRKVPAPFQGAPHSIDTKPRALPWAGIRYGPGTCLTE